LVLAFEFEFDGFGLFVVLGFDEVAEVDAEVEHEGRELHLGWGLLIELGHEV
jgi:hypothetical protein